MKEYVRVTAILCTDVQEGEDRIDRVSSDIVAIFTNLTKRIVEKEEFFFTQ